MPNRLWHLMIVVLAFGLLAALARLIVRVHLGLPMLVLWSLSGAVLWLIASPLASRLNHAASRSWLVTVSLLTLGSLAGFVFFFSSVVLVLIISALPYS